MKCYEKILKRSLDIFVSISALILFSPIIALVWILVRIKLGTPVLFRQQRPGLNAKPFYVYKFRSMTDARDMNGLLLQDSIRLTGFGKFLRSASLDELPQLFNVLKGDMSLVGPRPLLMAYLPLYTVEQAKRHSMLPGMVSLASVRGRNLLTWDDKFALDTWYVENWSLFLDIKILALTVITVIKSDGVNHTGSATMPEFTGSKSVSGDGPSL